LRIITDGGGLAIHFRGEAHSFVCFAGIVEEVKLKNAQKMYSHFQRMTCLGVTGGMRSTPPSVLEVMLMFPPLNLFLKQEVRQVAKRLGNGCSYVTNFGHTEVLFKMTDEMPLLLAPTDP
jgi:hypothetical protein